MAQVNTLADGFRFTEGPRWHQDRLWFSDMHDHKVWAVDIDGNKELMAEVPNEPSGLGWLPDGRLLVVSMIDRKLLRQDPEGLVVAADLSALTDHRCNDMVVDAQGRAYVGNFGFDLHADEKPKATCLILAETDGSVRVVAEDVMFPNGTVITPDGKTLILGESFGARLTAFTIGDDGSLSDRRVWAQMDGAAPDGICLDEEGAIWVASPVGNCVLRLAEGSEVLDRIDLDRGAFACMLGGPDRRRLFICTAKTSHPDKTHERTARIDFVDVKVPGAGLP